MREGGEGGREPAAFPPSPGRRRAGRARLARPGRLPVRLRVGLAASVCPSCRGAGGEVRGTGNAALPSRERCGFVGEGERSKHGAEEEGL